MPRQSSRLKDEDYLSLIRRNLTPDVVPERSSSLSRLLNDPGEFGMSRSPAHQLRAKRLAERIRPVPIMGPTEGPAPPGQATGSQTSVKEGSWLQQNVHPIAAALGKAGQAVMGQHQETWQARLGATAQQLAESNAYQETVSAVLGGTPIKDVPAARALRPEQFSAVMAMKAEADKVEFAETADKDRRDLVSLSFHSHHS